MYDFDYFREDSKGYDNDNYDFFCLEDLFEEDKKCKKQDKYEKEDKCKKQDKYEKQDKCEKPEKHEEDEAVYVEGCVWVPTKTDCYGKKHFEKKAFKGYFKIC